MCDSGPSQPIMQKLSIFVEGSPEQADSRQHPRYGEQIAPQCPAYCKRLPINPGDPHVPGFERQCLTRARPAEYKIRAAHAQQIKLEQGSMPCGLCFARDAQKQVRRNKQNAKEQHSFVHQTHQAQTQGRQLQG